MALTLRQVVRRSINKYNTIIRDKKYRHRHLILETLYKKRKTHNEPDIIDISEIGLSFDKLSEISKLRESEVLKQLYYLKNEKEILEETLEKKISHTSYYYISQAGIASYIDDKYLTKGTKEFWENTYDVVKNLSTLILLIFAIITFAGNWKASKKNENEIETLKLELKQIRDSMHSKANRKN